MRARVVIVMLAASCGRVDFDSVRAAATDGAVPSPGFVGAVADQCNLQMTTCSVDLQEAGDVGDLVLVTISYDPAAQQVASVRDDSPSGGSYTRVLGPIAWAVSSTHTEVWSGTSTVAAALTVTVTYVQAPASLSEVWADEYTFTAIDTTSFATGSGGTVVSSGARATSRDGELIWGHGLAGMDDELHTGPGFTTLLFDYGDTLEDQLAATAGTYEARFANPSSGEWVAMLLALY